MKLSLAILALLFAPAAFCQTPSNKPPNECKGVVHGVLFDIAGKPGSGINLILDPPGDLAYVLPSAKSNDRGEFRFQEICNGSWGLFIQDEKAFCPYCDRYTYKFLYGSIPPDLKITDESLDIQQDVHSLPKPGRLSVAILNRATHAPVQRGELEFKVNRKRWIGGACEASATFTCAGSTFELPPDTAVRVRIKSKGFHVWKDNGKLGRVFQVQSGETQTITVELDPIQN